MKEILIIFFSFLGSQVYAQSIRIMCDKGDTITHRIPTAFVDITPPERSLLPEQFGYFIRSGVQIFNFRWRKKEDSKLDLKGDLFIKSIIVALDDDSLFTFHPAYGTKIEKKEYLYVEADITNNILQEFKNHKMVSVTLVADRHFQYDLFLFTDEAKIAIQKMTDCFLSNEKHLY